MAEDRLDTVFFRPSTPDVAFRRIEHLLRASQSLVRIESLELLLPKLLEMAQDVTDAEAASILLYDPEAEELCFYHALDSQTSHHSGKSTTCLKNSSDHTVCGSGYVLQFAQQEPFVPEALGSIRLKLGEGIAGSVAQERRSALVQDAGSDPRFSRRADDRTGFTTRNLIAAPLVYQGELLGVIETLNASGRETFSEEDVKVLECFACLAAVSLKRASLLNDLVAQKALEAQLQAASTIQQSFLPRLDDHSGAPASVDSIAVWAMTRPAKFVGGDLYDVIPLADGTRLAYVADVSGKGLPASLIMAAAWAQIRAEANRTPEPGPLLERVNAELCRTLEREALFVTIVACRYGLPEGRVQLASGGHPPPLIATTDGAVELERANAMPLGIEQHISYPMTELTLEPGSSLLLFSDGLYEAEDASGAMLGTELVLETFGTPTPARGEAVLKLYETFTLGAEAADDVTMLELRRTAS